MTFIEMCNNLDLELDKAALPYFTTAEKSYFLNKAQDKYVENINYKLFEVDEVVRRALYTLVTDSPPQVGGVFSLGLVTDLLYVVSVTGIFSHNICGTDYPIKRKIKPIQNDDLDEQDPFNKGTNTDPRYDEVNSTFVIYSDTPPTSVVSRYLKTPKVIDAVLFPDDSSDLPTWTHQEIVLLARDMCLLNIQSPALETARRDTIESIL
jgi:hypothetical protein